MNNPYWNNKLKWYLQSPNQSDAKLESRTLCYLKLCFLVTEADNLKYKGNAINLKGTLPNQNVFLSQYMQFWYFWNNFPLETNLKFNSHDGGHCHMETSPLIWFLYDRNLHHEKVNPFIKYLAKMCTCMHWLLVHYNHQEKLLK